jgi:hypothetical protein
LGGLSWRPWSSFGLCLFHRCLLICRFLRRDASHAAGKHVVLINKIRHPAARQEKISCSSVREGRLHSVHGLRCCCGMCSGSHLLLKSERSQGPKDRSSHTSKAASTGIARWFIMEAFLRILQAIYFQTIYLYSTSGTLGVSTLAVLCVVLFAAQCLLTGRMRLTFVAVLL